MLGRAFNGENIELRFDYISHDGQDKEIKIKKLGMAILILN